MSTQDSVEPDLGGPSSSSALAAFDWGLPFFMGRHVYIGLQGSVIASVQGPLDAF